jgi:multidrug efflux system membrane fusion protein
LLCVALAVVAGGAVVASQRSSGRAASPSSSGQGRDVAAPRAVPVTVEPAKTQDVPIIIRGLGTVIAFNTVSVRSRVTGNVTAVNFHEGQAVKTGDVLFQIDSRPFQAALDQANAAQARDQANLENARKDLARYATLLQKQFAPEQQYATQLATVAADEAIVRLDQAAIDAAKLNVEYASIRSPIDGVTGIRQVDLGNLVQANNAILVVLTQIKPIYVVATVPEDDIPRIRTAMAQRQLEMDAYDADDVKAISKGHLTLVNNQVDQTTGTVMLKAEFANDDQALWPGQFVNAHLVVETVRNGVTVPSVAVQNGRQGSFVYVARNDNTAEQRAVVVRQTDNNRALIGSGVKAGELVVTAGQSQLTPGAKVQVKEGGNEVAAATGSNPPGENNK